MYLANELVGTRDVEDAELPLRNAENEPVADHAREVPLQVLGDELKQIPMNLLSERTTLTGPPWPSKMEKIDRFLLVGSCK